MEYLDFAIAYVDDILIEIRNCEEHAKYGKLVFQKLKIRI